MEERGRRASMRACAQKRRRAGGSGSEIDRYARVSEDKSERGDRQENIGAERQRRRERPGEKRNGRVTRRKNMRGIANKYGEKGRRADAEVRKMMMTRSTKG
eukprot:6204023-Pleurochrysis_carterae.AAC.2